MQNYRVEDKFSSQVVAAANAPRAFRAVYGIWPFDVKRASQAGYKRGGEQKVFRCYVEPHRVTMWFGAGPGGDFAMVAETGDDPS